jgi:hypothetical protein
VSKLTDALNRIYQWLEINIPEFAQAFQSGLSHGQIESQLSGISLHLPEEIYDLYKWKNGIKNRFLFFPGYEFPPLQDIIQTYKMLKELDNNENEFWKSSWFPIFTSEVYIFADCTSIAVPIYYYDPSSGCNPEIIFLNLASMMTSIIDCYEERVYIIRNMGSGYAVDILNEMNEIEIMIKHNPSIRYWTSKKEMLIREIKEDCLNFE